VIQGGIHLRSCYNGNDLHNARCGSSGDSPCTSSHMPDNVLYDKVRDVNSDAGSDPSSTASANVHKSGGQNGQTAAGVCSTQAR
jgi:hypothetical protein